MIKNLLSDDEPETPRESTAQPPGAADPKGGVLGLFDTPDTVSSEQLTGDSSTPKSEPLSMAESVRGMGLAYSAGIAFTAAVVFMLVLGWGADLLLGTSPWGIVGGIILGSVIGFIQFFRLTSQIFKK